MSYIVKYTEAGTKKQKKSYASTEKKAIKDVLEFVNMRNVKNIKVSVDLKPSNGREGFGNPKFYR